MAKNKNTYPPFLLGRVSIMTGKTSITKAADIQLTVVAYGNTLGCMISDKYTQTTGPSVNPKFAINSTSPNSTIT
jgi:hypothetical protein